MSEYEKSKINWYNKHYKKLLIFPIILLILSLFQLAYTYSTTGQIINRDISLTGGTSITVFSENEINTQELSSFLEKKNQDFEIKELSDFKSGKQKAIIIETLSSSEEIKIILEEFFGYKLNNENSSVESTGSALGESFYKQLIYAVILSFVFMSIIVFIIFRSKIPSFAVIISAFADIVMTIAVVNILGMKISGAGITAILMLIGYSVDTDIMLTTRMLKRQGDTNDNLKEAFKTGLTMTLTSIIAIFTALIITNSISNVLSQIFTILLIGLIFDIINTWVTNVIILKWYLEKKNE